MKLRKKYLLIILCTVALIFPAVFGFMGEDAPQPSFWIRNPDGTAEKKLSVFDAEDGNYYLFLPSYADLNQVTIALAENQHCSINGVSMTDGMDCGAFALEIPYEFAINDGEPVLLRFYRSENVGTLYVDTASGAMDHLHKNVNNEENAAVTLLTADGNVDYRSENSILKGRGNSTWDSAKRPYALTLSGNGDLLGMGAATNWVLLANSFDETNLNNKLVLDLAARVGLPYTPDSRWVDVYLNGEYNGLYLLTEKVEAGENRLNVDTAAGDFLCKVDLNERWSVLRNPFLTEYGRTIEICWPKFPSNSEAEHIFQMVNHMEALLLSDGDLRNASELDLDSWVRKYIIDEISANVDSDHASSYFYYSGGVFFAGPVWDYDLAFGNDYRNQEPVSFVARNARRADYYLSLYYSTLYTNESFQSRMREIYRTEFSPLLRQLVNGELDALARSVQKASKMNSLRWQAMFETMQSQQSAKVHTVSGLKEYLARRVEFLNHAWLEDMTYCNVQFEMTPGSEYRNMAVQKGKPLDTSETEIMSGIWYDTATGEKYDLQQPVTSDLILSTELEDNIPPWEEWSASAYVYMNQQDYLALFCFAGLIALLIGFAVLDGIRRRKERTLPV